MKTHSGAGHIPRHVAIIMDGNGRWAQKRGLPRSAGHKQGAKAARKIVEAAAKEGVEYLTLFGFSSENWNRPREEIDELMRLLRYYLRSETAELHKKDVKLRVIGDISVFDQDIVELIENAESLTKNNNRITVIIALNYGGKHDIAQSVASVLEILSETKAKPDPQDIIELIQSNLLTRGIPDPDLLIRTSGEQRISNFLIWQCAYTEMVFSNTNWPDFGAKEFKNALDEYASRDRRFGAVKQS